MKLALASRSQPDWQQLASVIPTETLDKGDGSLRGYRKLLEELIPKSSSNHVWYSFYVVLNIETLLEIATKTDLIISSNETNFMETGFISGTVAQWTDGIKLFCQQDVNEKLRLFFTAITVFLESEGIRLPISKTELTDRTFHVQSNN